MGITERKEKQKQELRKNILDASMKLFVEEGFEKVSIRRIAEIIEYSPTTIYLHFKDKDEILFHLCEIGFQKLTEYNQNLQDFRNPLVRLHKMGENYLRFGLAHPEYYDLMFIQPAPMAALEAMGCTDEWHSGDKALDHLKLVISECMEAGLICKGNVDVASMAIWSTVHGLVALYIRKRFEKLVPKDQAVLAMNQSLTWLLNCIDLTVRG